MAAPLGAALLRPHRLRLAAGGACLVTLAATGAAYAFLTGPLLQLILSGGARGRGYFFALLPDGERAAARLGLWAVAGLLVALAALKGLAHLGQAVLLEGTAERVGAELRLRVYQHLLRLPLAAHRQHQVGDLLARLLDDVRWVQAAAVAAPLTLARELLGALGLLAVAIWTAPRLALVAAAALPLAAIVIAALGRRVKRAAGRSQEALGELAARAGQGLGALREVKSCGAEAREAARLGAHGEAGLRWALRHLRARSLAPLCNELMAALALGATLVYAGRVVAAAELAPERVVSFFAAVLLLYRPLKELGRAAHLISAGRASQERLAAILETPAEEEAGDPLPPLARRLELRRICFAYEGPAGSSRSGTPGREERGGAPVLEGLDLALEVGRVVAVTGPSGAGKSTLVNLLCGLERPCAGHLLWDGAEQPWSPAGLRAQAALVSQQPLVLDGTIAENLRYGAPDATEERLRAAAAAAGLEEVVARLPAGMATRLGPGGVQLSVGEVQRLAIARALLRPGRLLVLDEPSSALDAENEAHLVQTLRRVRAERAVLLVTHSRAVLEAADEVHTLRGGRLLAEPPQEASRANPEQPGAGDAGAVARG